MMRGLLLLLICTPALAVQRGVISSQVITADSAIYSSVPCCSPAPANGFAFLMNNFGRGNLINGVDYTTIFFASQNQFPINSTLTWSWSPTKTCSGCGSFAYGWPEISYGSSNFGSSWPVTGPWPQQVSAVTTLSITYNLKAGGNTNSYDLLLDTFLTTSPSTTDGSYVWEVSFFPTGNTAISGTFHTFTSAGAACVTVQGQQIEVIPVTGSNCTSSTHRSILQATVDLKEIFTYLVSQSLISSALYIRGFGIGPEMQVPAVYNSSPYTGSLRIEQLSYNWQ